MRGKWEQDGELHTMSLFGMNIEYPVLFDCGIGVEPMQPLAGSGGGELPAEGAPLGVGLTGAV